MFPVLAVEMDNLKIAVFQCRGVQALDIDVDHVRRRPGFSKGRNAAVPAEIMAGSSGAKLILAEAVFAAEQGKFCRRYAKMTGAFFATDRTVTDNNLVIVCNCCEANFAAVATARIGGGHVSCAFPVS